MLPLFSDDLLRIGVFLFELVLTFALIVWLRAALRGTKQPWGFLLRILGYGALTAIICAVIEVRYSVSAAVVAREAPQLVGRWGAWLEVANNFSASLTEELAKYLVAVLTLLNTRHLRKISDAVLYLILIGLGFSLVEDAIFLINPNTDAPFRLLSFYVHSGTSAIIGYSFGRFRFKLAGYGELGRAVLAAVLLHFGYNLATSVRDPNASFWLTILITFFISLQVFILFRKAIIDEYNMERKVETPGQRLLNLRKKNPAA
jgi:RsiW-degrading membrane proteinase PrsW (M82 family)